MLTYVITSGTALLLLCCSLSFLQSQERTSRGSLKNCNKVIILTNVPSSC